MAGRIPAFLFACFSIICLPMAAQQQNASAQATLEGKTISADGQPLRKTNLTLRPQLMVPPGGRGAAGPFQPPTPYATTSDANGNFSFSGIDAGRYTLQAERAGYINTMYGTKRTTSGIQSGNPVIVLTAGQHMTGVNIELQPQATISGKVTDEDGDPMPLVMVSAMRRMYTGGASRFLPMGTANTDDNGDFHINNLQSGRYYISFTPNRMRMQQSVRRTGADAAAQEMAYGTLYFPGAPDMESASQVDATEGQDKAGINVRMRKVPVFHVRGTVGGELPVPDPTMPAFAASRLVQVRVIPAGGFLMGGMLNMQPIEADGSFDTGGLASGTYTLALVKAQGPIQTLSQTTVVVGNRDVADIKLMAKSAIDISGTVRIVPEGATVMRPVLGAIGGGPLSNQGSGQQSMPLARVAQVRLDLTEQNGMGGNVQPAEVQADGSFTFKNVPPLRFRVFAQLPQGGYFKSVTFNGQNALEGVDMSSGGKVEIVVSMTAAQLTGTVNNADGQATDGAIILVVPDPAQPGRTDLYRQSRSRPDGNYLAPFIAPGKYRVYAFEEIDPGAFMDPDYMKPFESLGTAMTVADSDKKTQALTLISKDKAQEILRRAGRQ